MPAVSLPYMCHSTPSKLGPLGLSCWLLELDYCITSVPWVDLSPFWVLFILPYCVPKMQWKNTQKKHFCLFILTLWPLHYMPHNSPKFFHMIDDFVGFCQIQFECLFPLRWRISSVSFWGWSAFLLITVGTAAPISTAASPAVHLIEADAIAPELKPCFQSMTGIVENILTFFAFSSAHSEWGHSVVTLWSPPPWPDLHTRISEQPHQTNFQMPTSLAAQEKAVWIK